MDIELLVVPDCPNEHTAHELIATAVGNTGVKASVSRTVIVSENRHSNEASWARQLSCLTAPTRSRWLARGWRWPVGSTRPRTD